MNWLRSRALWQSLCCSSPTKGSVINMRIASFRRASHRTREKYCRSFGVQACETRHFWSPENAAALYGIPMGKPGRTRQPIHNSLTFPATSLAYLFTTPKPQMVEDITKSPGLHLYHKRPAFLVNTSQKVSVDQLKNDISEYKWSSRTQASLWEDNLQPYMGHSSDGQSTSFYLDAQTNLCLLGDC